MTKETLIIIDYGSGNLRSAAKSCERAVIDAGLDIKVKVSAHVEDIVCSDRILLPGQGAFADCMNGLSSIPGMIETLEERVIKNGVPFLGICVGMQLMASQGLEHGLTKGLGWIPGEVIPMHPNDHTLKIPHMGWNNLEISRTNTPHFVLRSIESSTDYYFVHSFMVKCKYDYHTLATVNYGEDIPAIIGRDNIIGIQFHPEKSQNAGLQLITNFLRWKP